MIESLDIFHTFAVTLVIAMSFLVPIRFILAKYLKVNAKHGLDKSNNIAFGVSVGGGILGFLLMLTGVISGERMATISEEIMSLIIYGLLGSILMFAGVLIQDRLVIRNISLSKEIGDGNIAASLVVSSNMAVIGLIANKTIIWVNSDGLDGILPIITVFILSQLILALVTFSRMYIYSIRNTENYKKNISASETWEGALCSGNIAVALRYVGQLVATGIVIGVTSAVVDINASLEAIAIRWGATTIIFTVAVWIGYRLFLPIILFGIDIISEVDHEGNVGIAAIEVSLLIGLAFMLSSYIV